MLQTAEIIIPVRFQEVDTLRIVWHGHYISFFEAAREAFGNLNGFGYRDMVKHEVAVPIVKLTCDYKRPLRYGDEARVRATYHFTAAAKIVYTYEVFIHATDELAATGRTEQVFTEPESGELILFYPEFMTEWVATCKKLEW